MTDQTAKQQLLRSTWSVGVFNLGHLWSDELGGVFFPAAAVSLLLLSFLHLLIVILQI